MKKLLSTLFILLLLVGCTKTKNDETIQERKYYIERLENFEVKEKNSENTKANEEFDSFMNEIARELLGMNFLNMHYSVIDYKSFGIKKPEVSLGDLTYGFDEEMVEKTKDILKHLKEFDYNSLSYQQQFDYETLEYSLYEDLALSYFYQYESILIDNNNYPESIYSDLVDYTFYDQESIDDYLTLVEDIPRFLEDVYRYTKAQEEDKVYQLNEWIDYSKEAIDGILNRKEDNDLILTFNERIDNCDFVEETTKEELKLKNKNLVLEKVLPSYQDLNTKLDEFKNKTKTTNNALINLDKDYAKVKFIVNTSCNEPMDEVLKVLVTAINYYESRLLMINMDEEIYSKTMSYLNDPGQVLSLTGEECLDYLKTNMYEYYPIVLAQYNVQTLNPDTASDSTVGYYYSSPLDNKEQNIIRINPNNLKGGIQTYITLAHEGFPGHLYQNYYYSLTNPNIIRKTINFIGYTEGYALMASNDAVNYADIDNSVVGDILFYNEESYFYLESLVDILTNYYGYSAKQIKKYCEDHLMIKYFDNYETVRLALIENPVVYSRYAIGACKLLNYRQRVQNELMDKFDMVDYNESILKNGPLPFAILDRVIDDYIADKK